jgi:DNA-binding HxlR family transcriptional regulator
VRCDPTCAALIGKLAERLPCAHPRAQAEESGLAAVSTRGLSDLFALIESRWTLRIITCLLDAPARFSVIRRKIPEISAPVLIRRLRELAAAGIAMESDGAYRLTRWGEEIEPVIRSLKIWAADRPLVAAEGQ